MKVALLILLTLLSHWVVSQRLHWAIPDFATFQHEGSIGFVSTGLGYDVLKSNARFSTHFGIVPLKHGGMVNVVSMKLFFKTATLTVWNRLRLNPFDVGVMGSFHYGDFEAQSPDGLRSKGYYWWHPALRAHLGMESSLSFHFKKDHPLQSVTAYIEFNTNERYFISFIQNIKTVSVWDVVKIGTGGRIHF